MSNQNCRIAALQMVSGPRVADNLLTAGRLVEEAVAQGAQLVALPEYFPIIGAADADRVTVLLEVLRRGARHRDQLADCGCRLIEVASQCFGHQRV